jgi:hypothetical protein
MVGPEPVIISFKRNTFIETQALKLNLLNAVLWQPAPQVIGLVNGELVQLDHFTAFYLDGYQFGHIGLFLRKEKNNTEGFD